MAIYHCSLKVFSRSKGHSAVAAAAYRSGCQLYDERIQKTHRYDKRVGVAETFILLPENAFRSILSDETQKNIASGGIPARAFLWNAVEEAEKRKNSCVARELILALPHELSSAERLSLTRDIALYLMERYRVAVDSAIHAPTEGDGHDARNHHAHILFSTRELTSEGFGKKTRILDDKVTGKEETEIIRAVWETLANDALKRAGFSDIQIDRRSLEDQGVDRIPETHIGNSAKHTDTHSQKSSEEDDSESTEGEEEGDGDQSGGGGAGDSFSPSLDIEPAELNALAEKEDTRATHDRGSRADFVEEIKALNAVRAGFSEIPLEDQITNIDKLMAKLDARVNRLERLKERGSLSSVLKRSINKLLERSAAAILHRQESQRLVRLSGDEKEARATRQKKRYGRIYRAGIHAQIKEMKSNIDTLKTKSQEYARYKSFVEKIEKHSLHERGSEAQWNRKSG